MSRSPLDKGDRALRHACLFASCLFINIFNSLTYRSKELSNAMSSIQGPEPTEVPSAVLEKIESFDATTCRSYSVLLDALKNHRAFAGNCRIGKPGFAPPVINTPEFIEVSDLTLPRLDQLGVKIVGPFVEGNVVVVDKDMPRLTVTINFHGCGRNIVVLDRDCRLRGSMSLQGNENVVVIGASCAGQDLHITAYLRYHAAALVLGAGGSSPPLHLWIEGPERSIQIGDEFLFSWGIWLRTADGHSIIDLEAGKVVNSSRSIVIGPHVWLGQDVLVMPGAQIGGGSIVGARSVVTRNLPAATVSAGVPARVLRKRTSWTRKVAPTGSEIVDLQGRVFDDP
jgi:hypothetical protein